MFLPAGAGGIDVSRRLRPPRSRLYGAAEPEGEADVNASITINRKQHLAFRNIRHGARPVDEFARTPR